jgi:uncharacterized protein (DUF1697 family)
MPGSEPLRTIAFLRAVNVGGRFVKMAQLAEHFRTLGYQDVETFINSGNVIFRSDATAPASIGEALKVGLEPLLGFDTEAFVRTEPELYSLVERAKPYQARVSPPGEVNIAFLHHPLTAGQIASLDALRSPVDEFEIAGNEVFWLCQCGQSNSRFSNAVFERKLRIRTTFRRFSMLERLAEQLRDGGSR